MSGIFRLLFHLLFHVLFSDKVAESEGYPDYEGRLREAYFSLFHEIQFRCTKNAMMNYNQAEILQTKGDMWRWVTSICTVVSASGVFGSLLQKGEVLANRFGLAGLVGLPICGALQCFGNSTSELIPSFHERAKKHASAAAGWMQIAEIARTMQIQMKFDPTYDLETIKQQYDELSKRKEVISKEILIPRDSHKQFGQDPEKVYLAIARRKSMYQEFLEQESKHNNSSANIKTAEDIYF